jgi:hypothetical protein
MKIEGWSGLGLGDGGTMLRDIKPGFCPWTFALSVVAEGWIGLLAGWLFWPVVLPKLSKRVKVT